MILELEREQADVTTTTYITTEGSLLWWKKRVTEKTVVSRDVRTLITPPSAWELCTMFSGANIVHLAGGPQATPMPMSAFSPDNLAPFEPFEVVAGTDVVMEVFHHLDSPAPFRAVLLGKRAPMKPKYGPSREFRNPKEPEPPEDENA